MRQAENTELRYHQRRLDILFKKRVREGWQQVPCNGKEPLESSISPEKQRGQDKNKLMNEMEFKIVSIKSRDTEIASSGSGGSLPKKKIGRSQTVDAPVTGTCSPREPQESSDERLENFKSKKTSPHNELNLSLQSKSEDSKILDLGLDAQNPISVPSTAASSYNLDTDFELDLIYERQFLNSSKKKTRPKILLSDLPPSRIRAAHIDKIRFGDRCSMDHMLKLVKQQRVNDSAIWGHNNYY